MVARFTSERYLSNALLADCSMDSSEEKVSGRLAEKLLDYPERVIVARHVYGNDLYPRTVVNITMYVRKFNDDL